jgi:hypothetical protein
MRKKGEPAIALLVPIGPTILLVTSFMASYISLFKNITARYLPACMALIGK